MRVGIYKSYKPILFEDEKDTSSWSKEIVNFAKLMSANNNYVFILSKSDYEKNSIKNIFYFPKIRLNLDILFNFNGVVEKDDFREREMLCYYKAKKNVLMATDLNLTLTQHQSDLYDVVLTQTKEKLFDNWKYSHLEKLILYGEKIKSYKKNHRGIFCGHSRNRIEQIKEFTGRDTRIDWYGKDKINNKDTSLGKKKMIKKLKRYKYGLVIADEEYYDKGFVTQRYFENCLYGVVNLVYDKYDKDELLMKKNDWRKFKNKDELLEKIKDLNEYTLFDEIMVSEQHGEIRQWFSGEKMYKMIMKNVR